MSSRGYPFNCAASCPCRTVATDPNCLCGFTRCDQGSPYCEVSRLAARAVVSSKAEGGPGLSESDALLMAFDKMAEWHRAEAKRRAGVGDGISEGAEGRTHVPHSVKLRGASDLDSQSHSRRTAEPQATPPKRKRRTKQEMAEFRASKQRQIQDSYESLVPAETREWLDAPDPFVQAILEAPHEKD